MLYTHSSSESTERSRYLGSNMTRQRLFLVNILVPVFLFGQLVSPENIVADHARCLQGIKKSLQDPQGLLFSSWDFSNKSFCNFSGIFCSNVAVDNQNPVTGIALTSLGVSGKIPESLKYCQGLQTLDLSYNHLSGEIPRQLCSWLPTLVALDLSTNNLSGPIPHSLAECKSLNTLLLSKNRLSGAIPWQLSTLQGLTKFAVIDNGLTGRIPPFLNEFGKRDFAGNRGLCGDPLGKCPRGSRRKHFAIRIAVGVFAAVFACLLFGFWWFKLRVGRGIVREGDESLEQVPGMPIRFSYHDIKCLTQNFCKKLSEGAFSSVFEGALSDCTKIAVKRLNNSLGQIIMDKSFFAEVKTIGSIHHFNLVRLVGFCTEKSHKLLVYEYMANGSLDWWIFRKADKLGLTWQQKKKIILDIAKGLNYLHAECHQKIIHLDIKPQNILVDESFNAKVSDFGLSKLVDKDQSKVVTAMRGTPSYLAPEWLNGAITEKVDIYSFGVVVLEIICGREFFDVSQEDEEDMYLLSLLKRKKEENQLLDIVNISSEELQQVGFEAVNMMKVAAWCLQGEYTKRPSMAMVVKVLEGAAQVEDNFDAHVVGMPHQSFCSVLK